MLCFLLLILNLAHLAHTLYPGVAILQCGSFSTRASVQPPITASSGVLVDWNLLSSDDFCSEPAHMPQFKNLYLSEISLISICHTCPQCSVILPQQYELPLTSTFQRVFLVTKHLPYNKHRSDIRVHYVIVDRLPPNSKNCELVVGGRSANSMPSDLTHPPMDWSNLLLVFVVLFAVVICTCSLRCACSRLVAARAIDRRQCKFSTASYSSRLSYSSHSPNGPKMSTHLDHAGTLLATPNCSRIPKKYHKKPILHETNSFDTSI